MRTPKLFYLEFLENSFNARGQALNVKFGLAPGTVGGAVPEKIPSELMSNSHPARESHHHFSSLSSITLSHQPRFVVSAVRVSHDVLTCIRSCPMNDNECRFDDDDDDDGTDCSPTEVLPFAVLDAGGGSETLFSNNKPLANKDEYLRHSNEHKDTFPSTTSSSSSMQQQPKSVETSNLTPFKSYYESIQLSTASVPPPGLMSSIISQDDSVLSTTPSIDDAFHQQSSISFWGTTTSATTQLLGQSSHLPHSRVWAGHHPHDSASFLGGTQAGSVGFSQLMQKADDANENAVLSSQHVLAKTTGAATGSAVARMPRLSEESELSSSSTTLPRSHAANAASPTRFPLSRQHTTTMSSSPPPSSANHWIQNLLSRRSSVETTTSSGQPYSSVPLTDDSLVVAAQSQSHQYDSGNSPAQPTTTTTWQDRRSAESVILDDTSYRVTIPMMNCTVREVMDVLANPDFLPLWCEPLHKGVIITKSSEGSCSAMQRQSQRADARQREVCGGNDNMSVVQCRRRRQKSECMCLHF